MPGDQQQWYLKVILDSTLEYCILEANLSKYMKNDFMLMKLMDIVSIVAGKGAILLVAD